MIHALAWLTGIIAAAAGWVSALAYAKIGPFKPKPDELDDFSTLPSSPPKPKNDPIEPVTPPTQPLPPKPPIMDFSTPKTAWHSTRVLCDDAGLSYDDKNLLCACIYQESEFNNRATHRNLHSTDWGLCQINDKIWSGPGQPFVDGADIVNHPDKAVSFMIRMFKQGELHLWVSYSSGAYRRWLVPSSPMWTLAK